MAYTLGKRNRFTVELKRRWQDDWRAVPRLHVVEFADRCPPQMSSALFEYHAGEELDATTAAGVASGYVAHDYLPDAANPYHAFVQSLDLCYVRIIEQVPGQGAVLRWWGVITTDSRTDYGYPAPTTQVRPRVGVQSIEAFGPAHLLNLETIYQAYAVSRAIDASGYTVVPATDTVYKISWCPAFNRTHDRDTLVANRTTPSLQGSRWAPDPIEHHAFCEGPPVSGVRRRMWSDADIVGYLLRFHQPAAHLSDASDPDIDIDADEIQFICNDITPLYRTARQVELGGRTPFDILNQLAARTQGLGWRIKPGPVAAGDPVEIEFFTVFESSVRLPDGTTLPAHPSQADIELAIAAEVQSLVEVRGHQRQVDLLRVEGARCISMFSVSPQDSTLDADWTSADEAAYLDAASAGENYPSEAADQARVNDAYRNRDELDRVFRRFIIPADWAWLVGTCLPSDVYGAQPAVDRIAAPYIYEESGAVDLSTSQSIWRHRRRILPTLPLRPGIDYTQFPPVVVDPDADQRERMLPMAWVLDRTFTPPRYVAVTDPIEVDPGGDADPIQFGGADLRVLSDGFGVEISYPLAHILAQADWTDAAPSRFDAATYGLDWRDLIVTVAVETDRRLAIERLVLPPHIPQTGPAPTSGRPPGLLRTAVLQVPEAYMVYIAPDTVISLDDDGQPVRSPEPPDPIPDVDFNPAGVVRNNVDLLEAVAAVGLRWYQTERRSVLVQIAGTTPPRRVAATPAAATPIQVGELVRVIDPTRSQRLVVNTLVEEIVVNVADDDGSVLVRTADLVVDPVKVVRRA